MRPPVVRSSKDGQRYSVVFSFEARGIKIPAGFEFDGATVPRLLWSIVSPGRPWVLRASCLHDFMYQHALKTKKIADQIFKQTLIEDGAPPWVARVMYYAVCAGGKGKYECSGGFDNDSPVDRLRARRGEKSRR